MEAVEPEQKGREHPPQAERVLVPKQDSLEIFSYSPSGTLILNNISTPVYVPEKTRQKLEGEG